MSKYHSEINAFIEKIAKKNKNESEFLQAVQEVAEIVIPFMIENPKYQEGNLFELM